MQSVGAFSAFLFDLLDQLDVESCLNQAHCRHVRPEVGRVGAKHHEEVWKLVDDNRVVSLGTVVGPELLQASASDPVDVEVLACACHIESRAPQDDVELFFDVGRFRRLRSE